jgi:FMN reductase
VTGAAAVPAVTVVVGNPRPRSRTAAVATEVGRRIAAGLGAPDEVLLIDLADHAARLFDPEDAELRALGAAVAAAPTCVVASPTYKATYTGLLKVFLDRFGSDGLAGVVAVPVMVGASATHALAPEVHLRPLLVELGALTPTRALYLIEGELDDPAAGLDRWAATAVPAIATAVGPWPPAAARPPGGGR